MRDDPLITIIIGIYNGYRFLSECIESVINQDYWNLEIILVDDGSTDSSGKIADMYAEQDYRILVIHQNNEGVSNARNRAIELARGEFICILDQDDIISRDYISYFYRLCKDNHAEISLSSAVDKFWNQPRESLTKDEVRIWTGEEAVVEMLYHKIVIAPWNKMIRRNLIIENNLRFNPKLFNGEGFAFSIQAYQHATRIAVGHRKVYHYRVGDPDSGASKFKETYISSSINAQIFIKETFLNETPAIKRAWKFSNWHTHCDCFNIMVGCKVFKDYPELYNGLKKYSQKNAMCALRAPVSVQQKLRGILFRINPYIAARIINFFRMRKFKTDSDSDI